MVSEEEDVVPNDDNICNDIFDWRKGVVPVTCDYKDRNPPLRGRYVTIRRKEFVIYRHLMHFCEVEVFSCPPGSWEYNMDNADDCSKSCDGCNNTVEMCRVSDGYCYSGCKDGFWGGFCDIQCDCKDGAFCNSSSGSCPKGIS